MIIDLTALFDMFPDLATYCAMADEIDELRHWIKEVPEDPEAPLWMGLLQDRLMENPIHAAFHEWRERNGIPPLNGRRE